MTISQNNNFFSILAVIYLLYVSAGKIVFELSGFNRLYLILLTTIFLLPLILRIKIYIYPLVVLVILIFSVLISHFNYRTPLDWSVWIIANLIISYLVLAAINKSVFPEIFVKSVSIIALTSIIFWLVHIIVKPDYSFFPRITLYHVNLWLTVVVDDYSLFQHLRNQSIFWEPGAYQVVLSIALYLENFFIKNPSKFRIFLFVIALISTISAASFISLFFFFLINFKLQSKIKTSSILYFTLIFILLIFFYDIYKDIVFKVYDFFTGNIENNPSSIVRYNSIFLPFQLIKEFPFFGAGIEAAQLLSIEKNNNMLTQTFLNIAAIFGIPIFILHFVGILMLTKKIELSNFKKFLSLIWLISIFSSQNFFTNPIYLILIFYGLSLVNEKINEKTK